MALAQFQPADGADRLLDLADIAQQLRRIVLHRIERIEAPDPALLEAEQADIFLAGDAQFEADFDRSGDIEMRSDSGDMQDVEIGEARLTARVFITRMFLPPVEYLAQRRRDDIAAPGQRDATAGQTRPVGYRRIRFNDHDPTQLP